MNASSGERVIVSVGGSLLVPNAIDTDFLKQFRDLILKRVQEGFSFSIIVGGGKTARAYQDAARSVSKEVSTTDLDWIGIHATRINAHLLRTALVDVAHPHVIKNPEADIDIDKPVTIASGWQPGSSTDYGAVLIAKNLGARRVVNLSNIDYVYDSDPKQNKGAKKLEKTSWAEFRKLIPDDWDPGLSSPFDPVAAKEAEALGLEVAIINGAHLDRFDSYLDNKPFTGTTIS